MVFKTTVMSYWEKVFLFTSFSLLLLFHNCLAQVPTKKIKEFKAGKINTITTDRLGNFFLVLKNGQIKKYDANGKLVATTKATVDLLEPWFHPSIFAFSRGHKKFTRYGRNFENPVVTEIDASWAIEPYLVTVRADNHIWILDRADAMLKHINPVTSATVSEFAIDTLQLKNKPSFTHIREYQNMLFVLDQNSGILIFTIFGRQIGYIKKSGILHFNFVGEELYYAHDNTIQFFDLTTGTTREVKVEGHNPFALVTDERILLIDNKGRVQLWEISHPR
ncbi:MAG: hypothetical protein ACKO96_03245 [Flammeovirgaceae bacterium]